MYDANSGQQIVHSRICDNLLRSLFIYFPKNPKSLHFLKTTIFRGTPWAFRGHRGAIWRCRRKVMTKVKNWEYVVLSRVRTLSGLYLVKPIDMDKSFQPSPQLASYMDKIRTFEKEMLEQLQKKQKSVLTLNIIHQCTKEVNLLPIRRPYRYGRDPFSMTTGNEKIKRLQWHITEIHYMNQCYT